MIPKIILYFRTGAATNAEHHLMHSIFGKLWHSIETEINRGNPMDPLLKGILNTIRKSDLIRSRPVKSNSVLIRRRRNLVVCVNHATIAPADNLMNCVWSIIARRQLTTTRKLQQKQQSVQKAGGVSRRKRSLVVSTSDVEVLKSFINMVNTHNAAQMIENGEGDHSEEQPSIYELLKVANQHRLRKLGIDL